MDEFARGVDISSLDEVERLGGRFYLDKKETDIFDIFESKGINYVRLRLWNDATDSNGNSYGAGTCDLDTVIRLAKRIKAHNMKFLLDFHYSDYWCDPQRQILPKAWKDLSFDEIKVKLYEFTKETLLKLKSLGLEPDMIQVGNEITNGMLWPYGRVSYDEKTNKYLNLDTVSDIVKLGIKACNEVTNAKIMIHLERSYDVEVYRQFFDAMVENNVKFDVIGLSYYPFWHKGFSDLKKNLEMLSDRYHKEIHIVETSYAYTGKCLPHMENDQPLVIRDGVKQMDGSEPPYPLTVDGQKEFLNKVYETIKSINGGNGIFYWEPAWLPVKGSTWATEAGRKYINEEYKKDGNEWANQALFDYKGNALEGLNVFKDWR